MRFSAKKVFLFAAVAATGLCFVSLISDAAMIRRTLNELVSESHVIAVGTVKSLSYTTEGLDAFTRVTIQTEQHSALGNVPGEITFVVPGGKLSEDLVQLVSTSPQFAVGERALIILRQGNGGSYELVSGYQGKIGVTKGNRISKTGKTLAELLGDIKNIREGKAAGSIEAPPPQVSPLSEAGAFAEPASTCCTYMEYEGFPIRHSSSCPSINFKINPNCPDVPDEDQAVLRAAASWNNVTCSCAVLNYIGTATTCSDASADQVICWKNFGSSSPVAVTKTWFSSFPTKWTITGFHLEFNTYYTWSNNCSAGTMDIETVALHELGHVLALGDFYDGSCSAYTMYGYVALGQCKRNPCKDEECLSALYANGQACQLRCTVSGPSSPTNQNPITFNITFTQRVTGLTASEIVVTNGTKGALSGSGASYNIPVTPLSDGAVTCQVIANAAQDTCSRGNIISNTASVTYDGTPPSVTVNQASGQADPTADEPIYFTAVFSEAVTGFTASDVVITGTAGGTKTAKVTGGPSVYSIAVDGMTSSGTVTITIPAGAAQDSAGNPSLASTSTDNTVTYEYTWLCSSDVPKSIPDKTTIESSMPISLPGRITDANVVINVSHTYVGDLQIYLVGPDNTTVTLVNRRGGSGDNFTNTVFDDEASVPITSGSAPFTGYYKPEQALSAFDGKAPSGTWKLRIYDARNGDTGVLNSWCLKLYRDVLNVTINQASQQADPTNTQPVKFTAVFSAPVTGFTGSDVAVSGTAPGTKMVNVTGGPATYTVEINGITGPGTVIASIPACVAQNSLGTCNEASTSSDNTVEFDNVPPQFTGITANPPAINASQTTQISFNASEVLSANPAVAVNGDSALFDSKNGNAYTYSYTAQCDCTSGSATISITGYDLAGNMGNATAGTVLSLNPNGSTIADAKNAGTGIAICLNGQILYMKGSGFGYVAESPGIPGIRIEGDIPALEENRVCLCGTVQLTAGGERYIQITSLLPYIPQINEPIEPYSANNRALQLRILDGIYVLAWGRVLPGSIGPNSFVITDGASGTGLIIYTQGSPAVSPNSFVVVRGAAGYDGARVIYAVPGGVQVLP